MIVFSASRVRKGSKVQYKNYRPLQVQSMERVAELAREYSLSSYMYGTGRTDTGEICEGHRAGKSVVGPGSVILMDFDNKGATFEMLCDRLAGVSAWVGPSKSWSDTVLKFHVVVELDRELPLDAAEFTRWYRAVVQWFDLGSYYDPAMESWTQQMAPHWHEVGTSYPEKIIVGAPLDMDAVLTAYIPDEEVRRVGQGSISGSVPTGTEFVVSRTGEVLSIADIQYKAAKEGKVRVHCIAGIEHDGRKDTALVRHADGATFYYCSGGRCKHTLIVQDPEPFDEELDEGSAVPKSNPPVRSQAKVLQMLNTVQQIIGASSAHSMVYVGRRVNDGQKEAAVSYSGEHIMQAADVRKFDGYIRYWDSKKWPVLFEDDDAVYQFAQELYRAAGFEELASSHSRVSATAKHLVKSTKVPKKPKSADNFINVGNGMVRVDTSGAVLLPHDKDALFTTVLPFDYVPGAACPTWELIVSRLMMGRDDLIQSLQDTFGYLLLPQVNMEKMLGFVGEGENGKSTVQEVIKMLFGQNGYSTQPLHKLTAPGPLGEYARASLNGKAVNFTNELSPKDLVSEEFKNLISGVDIEAREPYGKPFTIRNAPKQVCAMNSTERLVKENTHGFQRRLHLIPFDYRIKDSDKDPNLFDKLRAELAGIFNWALVGAERVAKTRKLTEAASMKDLKANVIRDANPVQQFVEEMCQDYAEPLDELSAEDKHSRVRNVNEVYLHYKTFATDNGYFPLGRNRFSKEMEKLGHVRANLAVRLGGSVVKVSGFYLKV